MLLTLTYVNPFSVNYYAELKSQELTGWVGLDIELLLKVKITHYRHICSIKMLFTNELLYLTKLQ